MTLKIKLAGIFSTVGILVTLILKFNIFYDTFIQKNLTMIERIDFFLIVAIIFTNAYLVIWTLTNFVTKNELKKKYEELNKELNTNYITKDKLAISLEKIRNDIKEDIASFKSTVKEQHDDTLKILNMIVNSKIN